MRPTAVRLRSVWFQLHKWIGITLAILVIPIALSGSALVWHDWLEDAVAFAVTDSRYTAGVANLRAQVSYLESST